MLKPAAAATKPTAERFNPKRMQVFHFRNPSPIFHFPLSSPLLPRHSSATEEKSTTSPGTPAAALKAAARRGRGLIAAAKRRAPHYSSGGSSGESEARTSPRVAAQCACTGRRSGSGVRRNSLLEPAVGFHARVQKEWKYLFGAAPEQSRHS